MRLFKKIAACFLTAALVAAATVPFTSSAVLIVPGADPNGDGRIDIADAVYIYQALSGKFDPSDWSKLDMDGNGVVSEADAYICQLRDAGVI